MCLSMCHRKAVAAAVFLLVASFLSASPAAAEWVVKSRLDPMNCQYEGLEINGDDFADALMINLISSKKTFLLGDASGRLSKSAVKRLSSEERADLPDMVIEVDVNGDKLKDLIVGSRERLTKAALGDDRTFMRMLEASVYMGQDASNFKTVRFSALAIEEREIIERNAKTLLLAPEEISGSTVP